MIIFNIRDLASQIFFGNPPEDQQIRLALARQVVAGALEIFNYPATEMTVFSEILDAWESEYELLGLEQIIYKVLNEIKQKTRSYGWDPRCFGKAEFMGPENGRGMMMIRIVMDLEETFAKINEQITPPDTGESIGEVVSDNPDMETLNELSSTCVRQAKRDFSLLTGRSQPFVRDDEVRGWRVIEWDLGRP